MVFSLEILALTGNPNNGFRRIFRSHPLLLQEHGGMPSLNALLQARDLRWVTTHVVQVSAFRRNDALKGPHRAMVTYHIGRTEESGWSWTMGSILTTL